MGIETAIIGSAILGAAGSAYAGNKASKAATKAADSSNALQYQMFQESNALNEPWRQAGMGALQQQQALLGFGGPTGGSAGGYSGGQAGGQDWAAYLQANPDVQSHYAQNAAQLRQHGINSAADFAKYHYDVAGRGEGRQVPTVAGHVGANGQPMTQAETTDNAYNAFLGSGFNRAMTDFTNNDLDMIRGSMGAGGSSLSGSAVGAMGDRLARNRYNAFGDYYNATSGLSGTGAQLSTAQGQQGLQVAGQIGANNMNAANARGSSYMNTANAFNTGLQNATDTLAYGYGNGWFGGGSGGGGSGGGTPMAARTGPGYTDMRG